MKEQSSAPKAKRPCPHCEGPVNKLGIQLRPVTRPAREYRVVQRYQCKRCRKLTYEDIAVAELHRKEKN